MEQVVIVTRDINGKRNYHYPRWNEVCSYIDNNEAIRDEEILAVIVEDYCFYSSLQADHGAQADWDDLIGFFA